MENGQGYRQLGSCLLSGEYIVWQGRPVKGHIFSGSDLYMIPFSLMWGGFAIFWETSAVASGAPMLFCLWGIPFVLIGLYMIAGRFFVQQFIRQRTYYAVTDRRILQLRGSRVSSLDRRNIPEMYMSVNKDGSGTIAFGDVRYNRHYGYWWSYSGSRQQGMNGFALENIPDVNQVYRILSQQKGTGYETI